MISRRGFLTFGLTLAGGLFFPALKLPQCASFAQFFFAQIKYRGGEWDPNPQFVEAIVEELELRTSIKALPERRIVNLGRPEPFLLSLPLYSRQIRI